MLKNPQEKNDLGIIETGSMNAVVVFYFRTDKIHEQVLGTTWRDSNS